MKTISIILHIIFQFRSIYIAFIIFIVFFFSINIEAQVYNGAITASSDDAYEAVTTMNLNASYLSVGYTGYYVGLRFQNVTIPQGSTINSATFSAYYYTSQAGITVNIYGDNADNSGVFTGTSGNISGRTATTANANWTFSISSGTWNTSPSIVSIIQEIVNRPGWASGNAISIITHETGGATNWGRWEAFDYGFGRAAIIAINYTPPTTRNYSGVVYSDEGITPVSDGTAIRIRVNGTDYTAATTTTSGNYSFTGVTVAPGKVVQVYIDGVASTFGSVTTVVDAAGNITNLNVFQNYVIARNDNAGITTNTNLGIYDGDDDTDIKYTSNAGTLTVSTAHKLYLSNNFTPGGTVNADELIIQNGIFLINGGFNLNMTKTGITSGTSDYIIDVRSGGTLKLDNSTSQITRSDVDADLRIQNGGELIIINGTLTGFDYHQVEGIFNISGGDLTTHNASGLGRIKFTGTSSGSQTGGTITFNTLFWALTGTTWNATAGLIKSTGNGVSNEASIYVNELSFFINNLTIDGEFAIQNSVTAADLDIRGNLIISPACTLNSNGKPITIAGNWTNNGTYTSGSNLVTFNGNSTINSGGIANHNFYNLTLNGTSATLSNHINIDNDFTISNGTWNIYSGGSFYDMYVAGEWINNATFNCVGDVLGTFDDFTDGDYTANPTWTVQSGGWEIGNFAGNYWLQGVDGVNNESISTESNQGYGTWEFQFNFDVATPGAYIRFFIIMSSDNPNPNGGSTDGYYVWVSGGAGAPSVNLELRRMDNGSPVTLISSAEPAYSTGDHFIKVTRTLGNVFELFEDGTSKGTIIDATYTSSAYMGVWNTGAISNDDHKIDNIKIVGMGGTVAFDGSVTQYVQGSSITTFNNLTINNSAVAADDGIIMQQSYNVFNTLLMTDGAIDMGNYNIFLKTSGVLIGETNDIRIFTSGAGTGEISATRVLNAPSSINMAGLGIVLTDVANLGATTIERGHKTQTGAGNTSINRYYDIISGTPTSATLRFIFFDRELNGQTANADMTLWKSADGGISWVNQNGTWTDGAPDFVEKTGITGFSRWTISNKTTNPLPINLIYFRANCDDKSTVFSWSTASENNNDYFTLERSIDAIDFTPIGIINGIGNSNATLNYSFIDIPTSPLGEKSGVRFYRLKQTDFDGVYYYSEIIAVNCSAEKNEILFYSANLNLNITFINNNEGINHIRIYDGIGKIVYYSEIYSFNNQININISSLSKGIYYFQLVNKEQSYSNRFVR